jgi:hypothetical protein
MRFKRLARYEWSDTPRKRTALRRKQRLEREALPLLAALIGEAQPSEDDVMAARAAAWVRWEKDCRDYRAGRWREARRRLATYRDNERRALRDAWREAPYPADPVYLLDMLHSYSVGRFTLDALPWTPAGWSKSA